MSADDMSGFINDAFEAQSRHVEDLFNTSDNLFRSISNSMAELSAYGLGSTLQTVASDRLPFQSGSEASSGSDLNYEAGSVSESITRDLAQTIAGRIFGDSSESGLTSSVVDRLLPRRSERMDERKEFRDNRGSFTRSVGEIVGGRGLGPIRGIQDTMQNLIFDMGGVADQGTTLMDGLKLIQELRAGGSVDFTGASGAGILDRVGSAVQDVATSMSGLNFDDMSNIASQLSEGSSRWGRDMDGDGDVDKVDIALAQAGNSIVEEIRRLHPLIAKMHRDPTFMVRKIERKQIKNEDSRNQNNQVNLAQQGIAAYIEDVNMFSVKY
jgi:hypothetical protein